MTQFMEEGGEEASSHHCFDFRWAHVFYYLTFYLDRMVRGVWRLHVSCGGSLSGFSWDIKSFFAKKKLISKNYLKVGVDNKTFSKS